MPEVLAEKGLNDFEQMLADQGKLVEKEFYKLYPETCFVKSKGIEAVTETRELENQGKHLIAQAAFIVGDYFAQADLIHRHDGMVDIFEIKSSSSMQNGALVDAPQLPSREDHIRDLAFQYIVATQAGYIVDQLWLVELNKSFAKNGDMDLHALFEIKNVTHEVHIESQSIEIEMQRALEKSLTEDKPLTCECRYLPRKKQCPGFRYMHPEMDGYNVYELPYLGKSATRLRDFVDAGIIQFEAIPSTWKLLDSHRDYISTWIQNTEIFNTNEIRKILDHLDYPLYFLDYETTGRAIPIFEGVRPYQQIPFQYSLHILDQPDGELIHREYLHCDPTDPMRDISIQLRNDIGDTGTIIVWNKTFERKCNENLAETVHHLRDFLESVNARIYDLMEIFSKRLYVHKDFHGSYSIKKVLPVLVSELSYAELEIKDGGTATTEWARMVFDLEEGEEKELVRKDLLAYCKLDTLAMVEIFNVLKRKISS
jgi:hypothetical protein